MSVSQRNSAQMKDALTYFERQGIDVRVEPTADAHPSVVPQPPRFKANVTAGMNYTYTCLIEVYSILFYTYCKVTVFTPEQIYVFVGDSGGLGLGEFTAVGVIYFNDLSALLSTKDFGVFYGAEDGGAIHVTWGGNGNATAVGIGDGGGAFGGRGDWS